jgi:hypothetical protein
MDPNVEQFTKVGRIIQDAVRCYREIYEEEVEEERKKKLFKQSSANSSSRKHLLPQPNNMTLRCRVSLTKRLKHYCI